jgi:hypothetical protein
VAPQALALHTTVSIFLDPRANLGLPQDRSGMFNLFIVACLLWATVRIPSLVRRYVTHSGGRNVGGYLLRAVVIHQLTRIVGLRLRRARATSTGGRLGRAGGPSAGPGTVPSRRPRPPLPGRPSAARPARAPAAGPSGAGWPSPARAYNTPSRRRPPQPTRGTDE